MAFCEMCGTAIEDGQTRCAACGGNQNNASYAQPNQAYDQSRQTQAYAQPKTASQMGGINFDPNGFANLSINIVGLFAQVFNILMLCLPILTRTHIWELGDYSGEWYIIPLVMIGVILASVVGYLLKWKKVSDIAGIVNLVCLLIIWFPFTNFTVGFYLWLAGVVLQLGSNLVMKLIRENIR